MLEEFDEWEDIGFEDAPEGEVCWDMGCEALIELQSVLDVLGMAWEHLLHIPGLKIEMFGFLKRMR